MGSVLDEPIDELMKWIKEYRWLTYWTIILFGVMLGVSIGLFELIFS